MMTTTEQSQLALANQLNLIVDFCFKHKGNATLTESRESLFRLVAFCFFTGKLAVSWDEGKVNGVVFYWPEWIEKLEAKQEQGRFEFEWIKNQKGDCLFVGDVLGSRKVIGKLYQAAIEKFPNLIMTPIYTLRRGKLVRLNRQLLERFMP